jgi:hypothetical protein
MSRQYTSFTGSLKEKNKLPAYYIVKDDFIVNLRKGLISKTKR